MSLLPSRSRGIILSFSLGSISALLLGLSQQCDSLSFTLVTTRNLFGNLSPQPWSTNSHIRPQSSILHSTILCSFVSVFWPTVVVCTSFPLSPLTLPANSPSNRSNSWTPPKSSTCFFSLLYTGTSISQLCKCPSVRSGRIRLDLLFESSYPKPSVTEAGNMEFDLSAMPGFTPEQTMSLQRMLSVVISEALDPVLIP